MDKDRPTSLVALRDARERTIATLSDAFARDDLDMDDFEQRLGIAHRTDSLAELERLTADLTAPAAPPTVALAKAPATAQSLEQVRDQQTLVAIIGGTDRSGYWKPARKLRVIAVMGGVNLDFREAVMAPGVTEVHVTAVMGGVNIIVPPQLAVEMDGIAIMGGFAHSERAAVQPDPDRPILRVTGVAVWGGVNIETRLVGETEQDVHRRHREQRALNRASRRRALPPRRE